MLSTIRSPDSQKSYITVDESLAAVAKQNGGLYATHFLLINQSINESIKNLQTRHI